MTGIFRKLKNLFAGILRKLKNLFAATREENQPKQEIKIRKICKCDNTQRSIAFFKRLFARRSKKLMCINTNRKFRGLPIYDWRNTRISTQQPAIRLLSGRYMNPKGIGGFEKGISGNLQGRPEDILGKLIREEKGLPEQLLKKVKKLTESKNEMVSLKAIEFIADRGWGKPAQRLDANVNIVNYKEIFEDELEKRKKLLSETND